MNLTNSACKLIAVQSGKRSELLKRFLTTRRSIVQSFTSPFDAHATKSPTSGQSTNRRPTPHETKVARCPNGSAARRAAPRAISAPTARQTQSYHTSRRVGAGQTSLERSNKATPRPNRHERPAAPKTNQNRPDPKKLQLSDLRRFRKMFRGRRARLGCLGGGAAAACRARGVE